MKSDKILICMSSLLRYFNVSIHSFVDRVVKKLPNKPDFIGHFPTQSKTIENQKSIEFLSKYVNIRNCTFENDPPPDTFDSTKFTENLNSFQRNGMIGNFYQWNNMKKCSLIKDDIEKNDGDYDLVIWSRPDLFFYNDIEDVSLIDDRFWLVGHDNHLCGLNDRFCLGNSMEMKFRMNIIDYFMNEWYPNYSNDESILFKSKSIHHANHNPQWNPEIVYRTYIRNQLNLHTGKLSLCFGKLRTNNLATIPYWFKKHGNDYTGNECVEDKFNNYVYEKTTKCSVSSSDISSNWGLVDISKYQSLT